MPRRADEAGWTLLSLERPACRVGPGLMSGNLDSREGSHHSLSEKSVSLCETLCTNHVVYAFLPRICTCWVKVPGELAFGKNSGLLGSGVSPVDQASHLLEELGASRVAPLGQDSEARTGFLQTFLRAPFPSLILLCVLPLRGNPCTLGPVQLFLQTLIPLCLLAPVSWQLHH